MRRMDALHDPLGVAFTALVEIAVSTITSLSVCALVGFQVTLVPWYVRWMSHGFGGLTIALGNCYPLSSHLSALRTCLIWCVTHTLFDVFQK